MIPSICSAGSSNICKLSLPEGCTGSVVLDVFQDVILVCGVSLIRPDQLFIGRFNSDKINEEPIEWKCLTGNNKLPPTQSLASDVLSFKLAGDMEYEVFQLNKFTLFTRLKYLFSFYYPGYLNLPEESNEKDSVSCSSSWWPSRCLD